MTCQHDDEAKLLAAAGGSIQQHIGDDPHAVAQDDLSTDAPTMSSLARHDQEYLDLLVRAGQRDQDLGTCNTEVHGRGGSLTNFRRIRSPTIGLFVWACLAYKPWLKVLLANLM